MSALDWSKENVWEQQWWGNCCNTFQEECKHYIYSGKMGLEWEHNGFINLKGKLILDLGGGPVSLLLKTYNGTRIVLDPCKYPQWVLDRYIASDILFYSMKAEDISVNFVTVFDEVWMYNVLLHVEDPIKVINNAKRITKLLRVVECINTQAAPGHPHTFTSEWLDSHLEGKGTIDDSRTPPISHTLWSGVFKGVHYEEV